MIGYAPGGSAEAGARPLAKALEPLLGQPLVFDYRPGNAGGVAMEAIARAPADGYTLYTSTAARSPSRPHLNKVGYDNLKSFTHLGHVCGSGSLLVVHPSTPFRSVNDVISFSKKSRRNGATAPPRRRAAPPLGEYSERHRREPAARAVQGRRPAMTDLMGGQIPMLFSSLAPALGAVKSAKIRALAVTSPRRAAAFRKCRRWTKPGSRASIPLPGMACSGRAAAERSGGALDAGARKSGRRQRAHGADQRTGSTPRFCRRHAPSRRSRPTT